MVSGAVPGASGVVSGSREQPSAGDANPPSARTPSTCPARPSSDRRPHLRDDSLSLNMTERARSMPKGRLLGDRAQVVEEDGAIVVLGDLFTGLPRQLTVPVSLPHVAPHGRGPRQRLVGERQ